MNSRSSLDTVKSEKAQRISFLLRIWSLDETGRAGWRASLEVPGTGKRIGFASLEQLFVYLIDLSESGNSVFETENRE